MLKIFFFHHMNNNYNNFYNYIIILTVSFCDCNYLIYNYIYMEMLSVLLLAIT